MFIIKLVILLIMLSSQRNTRKYLIEISDENRGSANKRRQGSVDTSKESENEHSQESVETDDEHSTNKYADYEYQEALLENINPSEISNEADNSSKTNKKKKRSEGVSHGAGDANCTWSEWGACKDGRHSSKCGKQVMWMLCDGDQEEKATSEALANLSGMRREGGDQEEKATSEALANSSGERREDGDQEEKATSEALANSFGERREGTGDAGCEWSACKNGNQTSICGKKSMWRSCDGDQEEKAPSEALANSPGERKEDGNKEEKDTSEALANSPGEGKKDGCTYDCDGWPKKHCKSKTSDDMFTTCIAKENSDGVQYSNYPKCGQLPDGCLPCWPECEKKNA